MNIMTRKSLAACIKQAATDLGYCFHSGFDYRMNETIIAYPAVWLSPAKVVGVDGINEGRVKYRVALQMMTLAGKAGKEKKEEMWNGLEQNAIELYRKMAQSSLVSSVSVTECAPGEFSMTNHGELSVCLKMDVEMPFCNL